MGCNIHDWMLSFLYIYESKFFGQTNEKEAISFSSVPNGEYELRIWSPRIKNNRAIVKQTLTLPTTTSMTQMIEVRKKLRRKPRIENEEY